MIMDVVTFMAKPWIHNSLVDAWYRHGVLEKFESAQQEEPSSSVPDVTGVMGHAPVVHVAWDNYPNPRDTPWLA